MSSKHPKMT